MNDDRWIDLKVKLREKFRDIHEEVTEESGEDDTGQKIPAKIETIEFNSPLGKLRMVRTTRPKVVDKKAHYHKGAGGAKVEYVLSDNEFSHRLDVYKQDEVTGEWRVLDVPGESFSA